MNMYLDKKKIDLISKYLSNKHKRTKTSLQTHNFNTNYNYSNIIGNVVPFYIQQLTNRSCKSNRHSYLSLNQSKHNNSLGGSIYSYNNKVNQIKNKKKTVLQKTTRQHSGKKGNSNNNSKHKKIQYGNCVQKGNTSLSYRTAINYSTKNSTQKQ